MPSVSHSHYIDAIDGLRALAVVSVVAFHLNPSLLPGGFTGVDVFFVISGYVISKSLHARPRDDFGGYILEFYKRRLIRILPALIACLLGTMFLARLFTVPSWMSSSNDATGLAAFAGLSNFYLLQGADGYFNDRVEFNPFVHTWSLAVEEQFYVIFPLLFFFWLKAIRPDRQVGRVRHAVETYAVPVVGLASLAYGGFETSFAPQNAFYLLPSRFWELAIGAALFQAHARGCLVPESARKSAALSGAGVVLIAAGMAFSDPTSFPLPWALAPTLGTALLIAGTVVRPSGLSLAHAVLTQPQVRYIGWISYSLYLWHWPVIILMRWTVGIDSAPLMVAAVLLATMLAMASYHFLERPIRGNRHLRQMTSWKAVALSVVVTGVLWAGAYEFVERHWLFRQTVVATPAWDRYEPRHSPVPIAERTWSDRTTIFLFGDSHAVHYTTMVRDAAKSLGIHFVRDYLAGCGIVDLWRPLRETDGCRTFFQETVAKIIAEGRPGDIVFLASIRTYPLGTTKRHFTDAELADQVLGHQALADRAQSLAAMIDLVGKLTRAGLEVLIDAPKPVFWTPIFRCADWFNRMNARCRRGPTVERSFLRMRDRPIRQSLQAVQARYPSVEIWDSFPLLCPGPVCSAYDGAQPLYFDGHHLTKHANQMLQPAFEATIREMLAAGGERHHPASVVTVPAHLMQLYRSGPP
ncbi:MAG: acyltransferase family protein [Alphaproteobacteria bacterium]